MDENKKVFTEVIRRQMAILGPDITLAKVKNVPGIEVNQNGEVVNITGNPQQLLQDLIDQFVELSGLIVKKTMESIIASSPNGIAIAGSQMAGKPVTQVPQQAVQQAPQVTQQTPQTPSAYSQPQQPEMHKDTDSNILSANRDIEDLNKMLNNINK